MVLIEESSIFIKRIDDQEVSPDVGSNGPDRRICQECGAQPVSLEVLINGQTTNQNRGKGRIARELLAPILIEIGEGHMGRGECVETRNRFGRHVDRDESRCDPPSDILADLCPKVMIKATLAASE